MAHYEPPHQDLRCLQIQLFLSLVVKELRVKALKMILAEFANSICIDEISQMRNKSAFGVIPTCLDKQSNNSLSAKMQTTKFARKFTFAKLSIIVLSSCIILKI